MCGETLFSTIRENNGRVPKGGFTKVLVRLHNVPPFFGNSKNPILELCHSRISRKIPKWGIPKRARSFCSPANPSPLAQCIHLRTFQGLSRVWSRVSATKKSGGISKGGIVAAKWSNEPPPLSLELKIRIFDAEGGGVLEFQWNFKVR